MSQTMTDVVGEAPNSKSQNPNKSQISNPKSFAINLLVFGIWRLEFYWDLEFWQFVGLPQDTFGCLHQRFDVLGRPDGNAEIITEHRVIEPAHQDLSLAQLS